MEVQPIKPTTEGGQRRTAKADILRAGAATLLLRLVLHSESDKHGLVGALLARAYCQSNFIGAELLIARKPKWTSLTSPWLKIVAMVTRLSKKHGEDFTDMLDLI